MSEASHHALIRVWSEEVWWLACCNPGCTYRMFESAPTHPSQEESE